MELHLHNKTLILKCIKPFWELLNVKKSNKYSQHTALLYTSFCWIQQQKKKGVKETSCTNYHNWNQWVTPDGWNCKSDIIICHYFLCNIVLKALWFYLWIILRSQNRCDKSCLFSNRTAHKTKQPSWKKEGNCRKRQEMPQIFTIFVPAQICFSNI